AELPELKRFTFFVSRRFEEGRERFRLHMGYFTTLAEAEEWLSVVRDIYPGAWAGEAPGKKLRARAAAAAEQGKQPGPQPRSALPNFIPPVAAPAPTVTPVAQAPAAVALAPAAAVPLAPAAVAHVRVPATVMQAPATQAVAPQALAVTQQAPAVAQQASAPVARAPVTVTQAPEGLNIPTLQAASAAPAPAATPTPPVAAAPVVAVAIAAAGGTKAASTQAAAPAAKSPAQQSVPVAASAQIAASAPVAVSAQVAASVQVANSAAKAAVPKGAVAVPNTSAATTARSAPANVPTAKPASTAIAAKGGAARPATGRTVVPVAKAGGASTVNSGLASTGKASTAVGSKSKAQSVTGKAAPKSSAFGDSNVREVLAALGDTEETGQTRMMPAPQLQPVAAQEEATLTDTQVLRYLESRRSDDEPERVVEDTPDASISLLKPDDTGTRRALKDAVSHNAPVSFAVQLQWAVQPVELDKVPPLAIFSAYTLYTVEGSREGRKWYGLRLGFFSDAISAKQVAYYVRSEFASVAVVPVSPQEKARATDEDKKSNAALQFPRKARQANMDEFKLIEDETPASPEAPVAKPAVGAKTAGARPGGQSAPGKRPVSSKGGRINARERRGPQTLEETLESLGASQLEVDNGTGETLNDTGVRHLRVEVQKSNTPFSRLLERLSERTRKS
ncbi:MAG TPA: hypothetical protein VHB68_14335, partial [Steroidobacteraceae bacterium]|nr:hypothetical protein [Steroidobacteraceae bacterium]